MFLTLLVIGLVGLVMMAIPAFGNHGPAHTGGHGLGHGSHGGHLLGGHGAGHAGAHVAGAHAASAHGVDASGGHASGGHAPQGDEMVPADVTRPAGILRWIPSPRAIFSVLALYGAFGNALVQAAHLAPIIAALVAVIPTVLIERLLVTPLWNLIFRFQGKPSGRLEELILTEATAVTPFRNGRGLVSVVRDGRAVQLSARLRDEQAALPIKVGERLRVEDVDAERERVTVSVLRDPLQK